MKRSCLDCGCRRWSPGTWMRSSSGCGETRACAATCTCRCRADVKATLQRMQRKTTPEAFAKLVETARKLIHGVSITTDVIVGFPGESDEEFDESLKFVREFEIRRRACFQRLSPRPGTAASRMEEQVPPQVRKERSRLMREALAESAQVYRTDFVGQVLPVLWESAVSLGPEGWEMSGLTDNYLRVHASSPVGLWN